MIYYLTGTSQAHIRAVLVGLYEATIGKELVADQSGQKQVPQNDGRIQFHHLFAEWVIAPGERDFAEPEKWLVAPVLKPGFHCALGILPSPQNPQGVIGPNDSAMLRAAGVEILREDEIDADQLALLPKFQ